MKPIAASPWKDGRRRLVATLSDGRQVEATEIKGWHCYGLQLPGENRPARFTYSYKAHSALSDWCEAQEESP